MKIALTIAAVVACLACPSCAALDRALNKPAPPPVQTTVTQAANGTLTTTTTPILVDTRDAFERAMDNVADGIKPLDLSGGNE